MLNRLYRNILSLGILNRLIFALLGRIDNKVLNIIHPLASKCKKSLDLEETHDIYSTPYVKRF